MTIRVVWAVVPAGELDDAARTALAADIDERRLARLRRFHRAADTDRGLAAHALLRRVLAERIGGKPAEVAFAFHCTGCGSREHGKPYLPGRELEFNLSHSGDRVAVALAPAGVAVGVDVEGRQDVDWAALRSSVFADVEWVRSERAAAPAAERARLWSRKEAAVKASGHGLTMPLRGVEVEPLPQSGWTARLAAGAGQAGGWDLDLDPAGTPGAYAAAVGVHSSGPGVDATAARAALLAGVTLELRHLTV